MRAELRRLVLAAALALAIFAAALGTATGETSDRESRSSRASIEGSEARDAWAEARDSEQRRRAHRDSADGREERSRSRTAFRNQPDDQALAIARKKFPRLVDAPALEWPDLGPGRKLERYLSSNRALVDEPGGRKSVIESTLPLIGESPSGDKAPIDLALEDRGSSFAPKSSGAAIRIPKGARGALRFLDQDFGIALDGARAGDAKLSSNKAFYANALPDADLVIEPVPVGAEISLVLRSPDSPTKPALAFDLPPDARLRLVAHADSDSVAPGSAEVVRDGKRVALVPPAQALDSQGESVPVGYEVDGDRLVMRVDTSGEIAWPVAVDPTTYIYDNNGQSTCPPGGPLPCDGPPTGFNWPGWTPWSSRAQTNPCPYPSSQWFYECKSSDGALYVWGFTGFNYAANDRALWQKTARPGSYIFRFDAANMSHTASASQRFSGICGGPGCTGWAASGQWFSNDPNSWANTPYRYYGASEMSRTEYYCVNSVHGQACTPQQAATDSSLLNNSVIFGMIMNGGYASSQPHVAMGGAATYSSDNVAPNLTVVAHDPELPAGWVEGYTGTVRLRAVDGAGANNGLGMGTLALTGGIGQNPLSTCTTNNAYDTCPTTWEPTAGLPYTTPPTDGTYSYTASATDIVGNRNTAQDKGWSIKVDRTPPGAYATERARWVKDGVHQFTATSSDSLSGVRQSRIWVARASDRFERTASNGWGTADQGGAWTVDEGPASDFSASPSTGGKIDFPSGGGFRSASLYGRQVRNADVSARIKLGQPTSGTGVGSFANLMLRRQPNGGDNYRVGLIGTNDGRLLVRGARNAGTFIDQDTGLGFTPGDSYRLRVVALSDAAGTATTVYVRYWRDGDPEPATWNITTAPDSAGPQGAGAVGVRVNGGSTTAQQFYFDEIKLVDRDTTQTKDATKADGTPCDSVSGCPQSLAHTYQLNTAGYSEGPIEIVGSPQDPLAGAPNTSYDRHQRWDDWQMKLDRTGPTFDAAPSPNPPYANLRPGENYEFTVDSRDNLSGVEKIELYVNGVLTGPSVPGDNCSSAGCDTNPSARGMSYQIPADYSGSNVTFKLIATDNAGNESAPHVWRVNTDDDPPTAPVISGALRAAQGKAVKGSGVGLHVEAEDGVAALPSSGVRQIELFSGIDVGSLTERLASPVQDCPSGNCTQTWDTTFSPAAGDQSRTPRRMRVQATDQAGNTSSDRQRAPAPAVRWRLDDTVGNIAADSVPRAEQVTNTSFETDTSGWASVGAFFLGNSTLTRIADSGAPHGGYVAKVVAPEWQRGIGTDVTVTAGVPYRVRVKVKRDPGGQEIRIGLGEIAAPNEELVVASNATPSTTGYSDYTGVVVPNRSGTYRLYVRAANYGGPPTTFYVDSASVKVDYGGTYAGGYTQDRPGATTDGDKAVSFDGTNGRVGTHYKPFVNGTASTFEGWAKRTDTSGTHTLFGGNASTRAPILYVPEGSRDILWYSDVGTGQTRWPDAAPTGAWFHWAYVFDEVADTAELFINGVSRGVRTVTDPYNATPGNLSFGAYAGGSNGFKGSLDDVAVYPRALSATEIARLYSPDPSDARVAYWRLNESTGTTAADSAPHHQHVSNTSFESDTSGWASTGAFFLGSSTLTRVADSEAPDGDYVAKVEAPEWQRGIGTDMLLTAGRRYRVRVKLKREPGSQQIRVGLGEIASPNEELVIASNAVPGSAGYTEYTGVATPSRTGTYRLYVRAANAGGPPSTFYVDAATVTEDNAGTYTGGYTLNEPGATADADRAVRLNGSSGYVAVPDAQTLDLGDRLSIEAWFKRSSLTGDQILVGKGQDAYVLMIAGGKLTLRKGGAGNIVQSTATPGVDGQWHHVVATKDGPAAKIYLDGVDVSGAVSTLTLANNSAPLNIGTSAAADPEKWNGWVDDVALYSAALSGADVARLQKQHVYDWRVVFDNGAPVLDAPVRTPSGTAWVNGTTQMQATLAASDPVSGIKRFKLFTAKQGGGEDLQTKSYDGCSENVDNLCDTSERHTFTYTAGNMPEGSAQRVRAVAEDTVANVSAERSWDVKVDRTGANVGPVTGPLSTTGRWVRPGVNYSFESGASDSLSGVESIQFFVNEQLQATQPGDNCTPQGCASNPSPKTFSWTVPDPYTGQGDPSLRVKANDLAGNPGSSRTWNVRVDDDKPAVPTVTGTLKDAEGKFVNGASFTVHVDASDGTSQSPSSGVKQIRLLVGADPSSLTLRKESPVQTCATQNCTQPWDTTFSPLSTDETRAGRLIRVEVEDQMGHVEKRDWYAGFDRTAPSAASPTHADPEDWWYSETAQRTATVNATDSTSGVASVRLSVPQLGGGPSVQDHPFGCSNVVPATCATSGSHPFGYGLANVPEGQVSVTGRATDVAGNNSWDVTRTVKVDKSAPQFVSKSGTASVDGLWLDDGEHDVTVDWNDAFSGVSSSRVAFQAPSLALDGFERTALAGWGEADAGGPWSAIEGPASDFSVAAGRASVSSPQGSPRTAVLGSTPARAFMARVKVRLPDVPPASGWSEAAIVNSHSSGSFHVRAALELYPDGHLELLFRDKANNELARTDLGMSHVAGDDYYLTFQKPGGMSIRAKAWKVGTPEPAFPQVLISDPYVYSGGSRLGLRAINGAAVTQSTAFDDLDVQPLRSGDYEEPFKSGGCDRTGCAGPMSHSFTWSTAGEPQGLHHVSPTAADPVGHQTQGTQWAVGLDRSGPALALSGALKDADGQTVYREDMALHMDARDGRAGNDATRRSGTERLQVWVDRAGPQDPADHDQSQACTPDSCAMEGDYTFSPTEHGPGAHTITVRATDKVGNQTEQTVTVTVAADEAGPELELSGDLRPPLATGRSVHIKALEERPADTGVRKIELWLDPDLTPTSDEREHGHEPDCSAGCPSVAETDWALDQATPPGKHEILIVATDDAGHRTEERYEIHVLDLLPSSRSKLGLEHWFDYDDTAAGGDSSVYVNGETGNTVWHSVPVVNPGRGLSTVVNLTYNSHDRGGVLGSTLGRVPLVDLSGQDLNNDLPGLSYSEAGVGFSLGISGPTRLNEPLGGVLIAQAVEEGEAAIPGFTGTLPGESNLVVTMTDSDGTVHTFTKGADGEWIAPPGVSMRLRRFQNGGTLVNPIDEKWALTRPDGITHFFDNLGYLTKTKDRNDNVLEYIYEPYDALTGNVTKSVVTSSGQNLDYALCDGVQLGKQTEVTLPDGTEVPVFCAKRVSRVKDPAGRELKIDYNDYDSSYLGLADGKLPIEFRADFPGLIGGRAGRINKITDHANREYTFEYDDHGYLTKFVEAANRPEKRTTELAYEDWKPGLEAIGQDRQLIEVKEGETGRKTLIRHVHPDDRTTLPTPGVLLLPRQACGVTKRNDGVGDLESVPVANQECRTADNDLEKTYDYTAPEGSTPRKFEVDEILMRAQAVGESATVGTTVHEIDDEGRPEAVTDPNGVKTALTWNEDVNAVSSIEEASGTDDASRTELDYDQANRTAVIAQQRKYPNFPSTDGARVTNFSYQFSNGRHHSTASGVSDADGQFVADMTEVRNPKTGTGQSFEIEQVAGAYTGNVTKRWDKPGKSGNVATTLYDGHGQIISEDDEVAENGPTIYEQHDPTGQPQKVLDPSGKRWDYLYDAVGNLTTVVDPRATDRSGAAGLPYTTTLGYDALDRLVNERIPRLSADSDLPDSKRFTLRSREFNRNGTLKTATDGEGTTTSMTYTPMDQPLRVTAPGKAGRPETTDHVYDDADRLIARVEPKGTGATVATAGEHQKACTDASVDPPVVDHMTRYCLDRGGQMIAEVRAATVLPPNGGPSALIKSFAYDRRGNVTGIVDPLRNSGRSIREATDAAQVSDPLTTSRRLTYEYDRVDERTAQIEHVTETGPDGRLPAKRTAYEYDANGNKLTVLPPKAFVGRSASDPDRDYQTKTSYDHRDLEVAVRTPAGCSAYQRREDGRITAITAPRGTTATDADDCSAAGPFKYHTTKLTYDAQGNLASRTIPFAQGQYGRADSEFENWKVTYERDDVGNATSIEDPRGNEFDNTFFDGGQLRSTTRPSWYELEWSDDHAPRDPAQRYKQEKDAGGDFELADGGPEIRESEIMSRNAQPEGERSDLPETHGQGDFGKVDPQDPGDLLPEAGATNLDYDREMRLTTISDAAGGDRTISYDEAGRVIGKSWPFKPDDPITHDFEYDLNGNLERYTDGRGKPTTYGYDGFDRRISETTRGAGRAPGDAFTEEVTRFAYDANDNLEWRQTPRGTALRFDFAYDSTDHLISEANPANDTWEYDYDVNGNRVKERSPRYQSATAGDKPDFERTFTYDPANRMTEDDPGLGDGFTTYEYDADGNVTEMTSGGAADANGAASARRKQTSSYDGRRLAWRRTTSTAGGDDKRTQIQEYDANGNLRRMIQGKGVEDHSRAKVLDAPGTSTADVTWHATLRDYDEDDQLVAVHSPWSRPPSEGSPAVDDPDGPSDAETGGDDRKIVQDFLRPTAGNPLRRVTSIVAPHESSDTVAARTSYTYFANGWVKTQSDEKLVRPGSTAPVRTANVTYDYDKAGNQTVWKTDEAGDSPDGRLVKRFFYDDGTLKRREAYKTKAGTDDETRRTYDYFYNENRSLVRIDDFDATAGGTGRARSTKIKRDEAERESVVNEDWDGGRDTVLEYDRAGNVTTRKTDGIYVNPTTYNGDERKVTTFDYDALDRETSAVVDPAEGDTRTTTTTWWDSNDMKTRTKSNGTVESYFYNARGEMAQKRRNPDEGDTETQDYDYDRDGNRTQDERGTHVFNPRGQLVKWTRGPKYSHSEQAKDKDGTVVTYERNAGGDVTKEVDNWKPTGITGDTTTTYRYHGERLIWTETSRPTVSGTQTTHSDYSYDDFGSVTKVVHEQTGPGSDPNEPPDGPPSSVSCSEMPNEAEAKVTRYCYDEFERRVQSRGSGIEKPTIYVYDGLDRRDRKTVEENGDPKVHEYAYVGLNDLLSRETDKDGKKKTYDYDSDGRRLGQSVKASGDSAPTHRPYATDASGSVEGLEDTEGRFGELNRDTYLYDPYGESENVGGLNETEDPGLSDAAKENPFRFQGFYFDSGVKTYDMQARDYRPDIGRFLSEDRYEAAVGDKLLQADPLTQNRYAFAGGNPVNNVEFDGHHIMRCYSADHCSGAYEHWRWHRRQAQIQKQRRKDTIVKNAQNNARQALAQGDVKRYYRNLAVIIEQDQAKLNRRVQALQAAVGPLEAAQPKKPGFWDYAKVVFDPTDPLDILLTAASAIPTGATQGAKGAKIALKGAKLAARVAKAGKVGKALSKVRTLLAGAVSRAGDNASLVNRLRQCGNSFTARTPVVMADGSRKPIARVRLGDYVVATDSATGRTVAARVNGLLRSSAGKDLTVITVGGRRITATDHHPVFVLQKGRWVDAADLEVGDLLLGADGEPVPVSAVRDVDADVPVYNLTVNGIHTYYAGDRPVLVHNSGSCDVDAALEAAAAELKQLNRGKNRVTINTPGGRMVVDLQGKAHYSKAQGRNVPTPHVKMQTRNQNPLDPNQFTFSDSDVFSAGWQEIRIVRQALSRRAGN